MLTHWAHSLSLCSILLGSMQISNTWASIPDYYEEPGFSAERDISGDQAANEVIDPFGGGLQLQYTDMVIPGNGGLDIEIQHTYRSLQSQPGVLGANYLPRRTATGVGWDVHFGRVWSSGASDSNPSGCKTGNASVGANPVLELADGTRQVLADSRTTSYAFITKDRWMAKCRTDGLDVYSPEGRRYIFNKFHQTNAPKFYSVTRIEDTNGNYLNFNYSTSTNNNGEYLLESITSNDNRTVTFTYDDKFGSNTLLRKITANNRTVEYTYKQVVENGSAHVGYYYLTSVIRSDFSKYSYSYFESRPANDLAGLYSLSSVIGPHTTTSPSGVETTYSYQLNKFNPSIDELLTTSIATKTISGGGVTNGTWAYQFQPGPSTNLTTVTTPLGKIEYIHQGSESPLGGQIWKIGVLLEKRLYTGTSLTQTEVYTWDTQIISDQNQLAQRVLAPVPNDPYVFAPILTQKSITRDSSTYQTSYSGHDSYGNPTTVTESGSGQTRTTALTYYIDTNKWIVNQIDRETVAGEVAVDRTFDANGNTASETRYGLTTSYTYHYLSGGSGDIKTIIDPRLISTSFTSYKRGVPQSEVRAEGVNVGRVVNNTGTIASETIEGRTTSFLYDNLNRIKSITKPKASSNVTNVAWSYSGSGVTRTLTRGTFGETRTYDSLGRLKSIDVGGVITTFGYDAEGNQTFRSDPKYGAVSSFGDRMTYDILGRLKRTTHQDGSSPEAYTENTYLSSNQVQMRDERGEITTHTFRSYGDPDEQSLVNIAAPEGVTTVIGRDPIGNITSVTQGGKTRTYVYDTRKFLDYIINPETGTTQVDFDDNENLVSKQVGSSGLTTYIYDGLNRQTNVNYPDATTDNVVYTYYPTGELKTAQKGASLWTYIYDDNRNLETETLTIGASNYVIDRGYNANDALQSITYPSGLSVAYTPNNLGQATKVGNYVSTIEYHPDGQISLLQYANGVSQTVTQDNRRRPRDLDVAAASGTLADMTYLYDTAGNTTTITDSKNPALTLDYDGLNRLKVVNGSLVTYDATGNIRRKYTGLNNLDYYYDDVGTGLLNTVTRGGAPWYSLQYNDPYGNITDNGFDSFVYDDASQLINVSSQGILYDYDGNGNRYRVVEGGTTTHTVYAADGLLMYEDEVGSTTASDYIYLGRQLIARRDQCGAEDTDSDGIPDCIETRAGLDPDDNTDAAEDADGDGLSNLAEYQAGTNYFNQDTDGDGMPDGFEVNGGLNALVDDAGGDKDFDGLTNLAEYQWGTDPNDSDTDGDGVSDGDEVAAGTDPNLNIAAVLIPIIHLLLN